MSIKPKSQLDADIIDKFPDNTQKLISPQRLRSYLLDVNDSLLVQRVNTITLQDDPTDIPVSEVTENNLHVTSGDRVVRLPPKAGLDVHACTFLLRDSGLVTFESPDGISGETTFTEPCLVVMRVVDDEWVSIPLYLTRPSNELPIVFNEPGNLTQGEEMRIGNTEGQNNQGWVCPFNGTLTKATISRGNDALADADISVNGVLKHTLVTQDLKTVHDIDVDVMAGDSIMVLGGATTPNPMVQPVIVLIMNKA